MFSAQPTAVVRWIWLTLLRCVQFLLGLTLTTSLSPQPYTRLHTRQTNSPPNQSNAGAFSVLPPELLLHIIYFLPPPHTKALSNLSQTCVYLHLHVTPTLYRTILFNDDTNNPPYKTRRLRVFLNTITRNPQLAAYIRSLTLCVGVNFPLDALEALEAILPRLGNLKHFNFDYTYLPGEDIEYLPSAFGSSPPFELERFLFRGVIPHSDLASLSAFLQSQSTSLRHLALHSLDDPLIPPLTHPLPFLRILETTVDAARSIIPTQPSITHFRAFPVVLSAYGTYEAAVHLAAQMKGLTHLQVNAEAPIEDIPTLLSPLSSSLPHLRFIRLTASFEPKSQSHSTTSSNGNEHETHSTRTLNQHRSTTLNALASKLFKVFGEFGKLEYVEMRVSSRGVFVRFFRPSPSTSPSYSSSFPSSSSSSSSPSLPFPSSSSEPSSTSTSAHGKDEEVELVLEYRWVRWRDARAWVDDWENGYEAVV
ncbi:hypothetical protein ONZ45_g18013 [Pleurotus djamor]|nr:hypothetical protein ONZ45_g18013 [Pleurotus djamor]